MIVQVAIKFIQRGEKMAGRYVEREIVNHSMLLHPHIIQFKEVSCLLLPASPHSLTSAPWGCSMHAAGVPASGSSSGRRHEM